MLRPIPLERIEGLWPGHRPLSDGEAAARRERYGPNHIAETPGNPLWELLRNLAGDPMLWFLVAVGGIYLFLGEVLEAATLGAALVPLAGMDAWLHRRTSVSTEGLRSLLATHATVARPAGGGAEGGVRLSQVLSEELVPGDLVLVRAGEPFPADGLIVGRPASADWIPAFSGTTKEGGTTKGDGAPDWVPAFSGTTSVQVEESALTGESYPVKKTPVEVLPPGSEPSVDGSHWGFAGTRLLTGETLLRMVHTGGETLYGEIVRSAAEGGSARTPLQSAIARLVMVLTAAAGGFCLLLAGVRVAQGHGWLDGIVSAVTLAVAAMPEEFPVVFTFFLGVGVYRLARQKALVRRSVTVENIGRVTVICSDKTGTITEGRLSLEHLVAAPGLDPVDLLRFARLASRPEVGDPLDVAVGEAFARASSGSETDAAALSSMAGATDSPAGGPALAPPAAGTIPRGESLVWQESHAPGREGERGPSSAPIGERERPALGVAENPSRALVNETRSASGAETDEGLDAPSLRLAGLEHGSALAVFPFTEDRRRETSVYRIAPGPLSTPSTESGPAAAARPLGTPPDGSGSPVERSLLAVTKGSPETILALCDTPENEREAWLAQVEGLAHTAHKVIAVASRQLDAAEWHETSEPPSGFHFAGLLAFEDPVREGVPEAIAVCREAGIRVVMVTGDFPATARAVSRAIGLGHGEPAVLTGEELDALFSKTGSGTVSLNETVPDPVFDVVARAVPSQKLRLVEALRKRGEIVAVTGDGVNDVPALRAADIGIAMGQRGTRSAREAAAIVLLDDNFRTIVRAIAEGRQLFRNLQLCFFYLLILHIPLVMTAALVPLAGYPLLYHAVHVVWLEMIIHPTALLVFQELPSRGQLERRPPLPFARFFRPREWAAISTAGLLLTGLVIAAILLILHGGTFRLGSRLFVLKGGGTFDHARAAALASLVVGSAIVTAALSRFRTKVSWIVAGLATAGSAMLLQTPRLAGLLHLEPLTGLEWLTLASGAALAVGVPLWLGGREGRRIGPAES